MVWIGIFVISAWLALKFFLAPERFIPPACGVKPAGRLWQVELVFKEVTWWVVLGILSSVGFGKGVHTGRMFLFPYLMQVVHAAEGCHTTNGLIAWYQHPCKLDCSTTSGPKDGSTITFYKLYSLIIVQCVLWGIGTALGELPPYAIARAVQLSSKKASARRVASLTRCRPASGTTGLLSELEAADEGWSLMTYLKVWTIGFIDKRGFTGVLLLASWPNAMFDICGMCCGFLVMPFWTFFLATLLGKGLIKVHLQVAFLLNVFGLDFFQVLLSVIHYANGLIQSAGGVDLALRQLAMNLRGKLVRQFELQRRIVPELLFVDRHVGLAHKDISEHYGNYDDSDAIARRVLRKWDRNKDGVLNISELRRARSRTDSKISLGALDPGTRDSWLKIFWEMTGILLQIYYILSIVDELAKAKQLELDEIELAKARQNAVNDKKSQ